ncbi:sarcosine oxidase [Paracoccus aminovorans]|uniref:Sarcosine oxidase n=1 Tax=Paracoccus aminovorans TaxID=34004 RepID=A0A1I3DGB9_9RHOB|nr:FAD-binding oxidoreductase [Paracoccus aminovorans]CQR84068.1 FAD dependent oxidoreductase [Paracoccus aminovorans]SFH85696.1 sarcosine oxidase [Paracoccus aminovorans]
MPADPIATLSSPQSLWSDTAPPWPESGPLAESLQCDVVVVGGGFTGMRAASVLAEAGASVAVLDAGDTGWGASGRNGGQVNPMLPFNSPERLRGMLGTRYFERLTQASLNSADELFAMIRAYGIDCGARQNGWLKVNHNEAALRRAESDVKSWNAFGAGMEVLHGDEVRAMSGSRAYASGVLTPRGGAVHPLRLAQGLAAHCQRLGVRIFGRSPALAHRRDGTKWVVTTSSGTVRAGWILIATNGYTGGFYPGLARSIIPLAPIQIATRPLDASVVGDILPGGQTISDTRRVIMFARREPDNRMVYGGLGRMRPDGGIDGFDWLRKDAERVYPQLRGVEWTYRWGGRIALTEDHLPHLHEPEKGVLIGLGYNGRGVAMSHLMGRVMAERVLGTAPEALTFPTTALKGFSLRPFKMAGLNLALKAMRLADALEVRRRN